MKDPQENRNVAALPGYAGVLQAMRQLLETE